MNIKSIERKVYASFHNDGTLDLIAGAVFLYFALTVYASRVKFGDFTSVMIAFVPAILIYWLIKLIKIKITKPRIGTIVFNKERTTKTKSIVLIPVATIIVGLIIFFLFDDGSSVILKSMIFGSVFVVFYSVAAYLTSIFRLAVYGLLGTVAFVAGKYLESAKNYNFALPLGMGIVAIIAIVTGVILLIVFISKYPDKRIGIDNE